MSIAALNWAWSQECPSAPSKLVLLALADKANEDGECWPGMDTVAKMAGVSSRQVSTHLAKLVESGLVIRKRRRSRLGRLGSYVFHLNLASGSSLPVDASDKAKSASGSSLPVDHKKPTSGSEPQVGREDHRKSSVVSHRKSTSAQEASTKKHPPKPSLPSSEPDVSPVARELTRLLAQRVKANGFKVPDRGKQAHADWLIETDRLLRIDKAAPDEVQQVIEWATADRFWRSNIRSAPKFRDQYPALRLKMLDEQAERESKVRTPRQDALAAKYGEGFR